MDERTLESATKYNERLVAEARARGQQPKTYTVVALGKHGNKPLQIVASSAQQRADEMMRVGIDPNRDRWAAGCLDNKRDLQIAGNNDEAKQLVKQHLGKR